MAISMKSFSRSFFCHSRKVFITRAFEYHDFSRFHQSDNS
jgi:hypothetical protein